MLAHRLDDEGADQPHGAGQEKDDADIAQTPRVERLLGQARLNEACEVYLLAVGVHPRPVERFERMLISLFRKSPFAVEVLVGSHNA